MVKSRGQWMSKVDQVGAVMDGKLVIAVDIAAAALGRNEKKFANEMRVTDLVVDKRRRNIANVKVGSLMTMGVANGIVDVDR